MAKKKVHVVEVVRHGKQFVIPDGINLREAIGVLEQKEQQEEEFIDIRETIDAFVWDGALALSKAMAKMYGWAKPEATKGFFGSAPPQMISVEISAEETLLVPWGNFSLPGVEGTISTGMATKDGRAVFAVRAEVKGKYEKAMRELIHETKEIAKRESIYRGKAIKIRFNDEHGSRISMPMPSFINIKSVKEDEIVFSNDVEAAIATNLYTPVEHSPACRELGIPLKRGVMLSGPYGTGKTLVAYSTASKCVRHNWTFLYVEKADELSDMIKFAHQYAPAVVFCEDIDKVVGGERDMELDEILNIIDGIESKNAEIMVVLTTNNIEKIHQAMLRPGRLDAVINVLPPDSEAVERLIRLYGRGYIMDNEDLSKIGEVLDGKIPALIRECVERSKLSALKLHNGLDADGKITIKEEDLLDAAHCMVSQIKLLEEKKMKVLSPAESCGDALAKLLSHAVEGKLIDKIENVRESILDAMDN
jgi:transitional endoplasmic reticulum ATPase